MASEDKGWLSSTRARLLNNPEALRKALAAFDPSTLKPLDLDEIRKILLERSMQKATSNLPLIATNDRDSCDDPNRGLDLWIEKLLEDSERRPGLVRFVDMNNWGDLSVRKGDEDKTIFTLGLGGCTALAVSMREPKGTGITYLSHYDPLTTRYVAGIGLITHGIGSFRDRLSPRATTKATLMVYSNRCANYLPVPADPELVDQITEGLRSVVPDIELEVHPYSAVGKTNSPRTEGTLIVEMSADPTKPWRHFVEGRPTIEHGTGIEPGPEYTRSPLA